MSGQLRGSGSHDGGFSARGALLSGAGVERIVCTVGIREKRGITLIILQKLSYHGMGCDVPSGQGFQGVGDPAELAASRSRKRPSTIPVPDRWDPPAANENGPQEGIHVAVKFPLDGIS